MKFLDKGIPGALGRKVLLILVGALFAIPSTSIAKDVILDGQAAINWLIQHDYITPGLIPKHNFKVFRSAGGTGPGGLKLINAKGWSLRGPWDPNKPIEEPIVIVVSLRSVVGNWAWFNGVKVTINNGGGCTASNGNTGTWTYKDKNKGVIVISWTEGGKAGKWIDTLTLSEDGERLEGKNQDGTPVSAEKIDD
jgi:hypothetical protein